MPEITQKAPKKRYYAIDELRGIAMVLVLVYHFLWSMVFSGYAVNPEAYPQRLIGWVGAFLFIMISGASCEFTRKPYLRALKILGCALLVWAATYITKVADPITFGVLHCLGTCGLIYALLARPLKKIPSAVGLPVNLLLFVLTWRVQEGFILNFRLPQALYSTKWLFWLGFPAPTYTASDYFPLLPWVFLFFAGYFLWRLPKAPPECLAKSRCKPLAFLGRHTLIVYLVHQPLFLGLLWVVQKLIKW